MTEEGYRTKFRTCRPEKEESPSQFAARISSYLCKWIQMSKVDETFEGLFDLLMREQFMIACNRDLSMFLRERQCSSIDSMCEIAERYVEAHGRFSFSSSNRFTGYRNPDRTEKSASPGKFSAKEKQNLASGKNGKDRFNSDKTSYKSDKTCFNCGGLGHYSFQCKEPKKQKGLVKGMQLVDWRKMIAEEVDKSVKDALKSGNKGESEASACFPLKESLKLENTTDTSVVVQNMQSIDLKPNILNMSCDSEVGKPDSHPRGMPTCKGMIGKTSVSVLRDTGCTTAVVREELISESQFTGEKQKCILIDGTVREFPLVRVQVNTSFYQGEVEALCMKNPVYDLIIGNIRGARDPMNPDSKWVACETVVDRNIENVSPISKEEPESGNDELVSVVRTRAQVKKGDTISPLVVPKQVCDLKKCDFIKAQKEDKSLIHLWEKASQEIEGRYKFAVKDEMLVRLQQDKYIDGKFRTIVVVPECYRPEIIRLAHDSVMSGHQGIARTLHKVSSQFYWPGLHKDVSEFVRSCDLCQRTVPKGKITKVPLGKVPLMDVPFKRIAMDIVGPIYPASERGKRFILTIMDYATRYPEAVALKNIEAETVAEALIEVYSRLGVPNEVLTDMGSQFTSAVMREVSRLLSIKQLTTCPYNPKCNGMVEKFNGSFKMMLKRMCAEKPNDWDRYLAPLLFAYRESPHESLGGFSPFDLLYGRQVRGPVQILKELLTKEDTETEVKTVYQYVLDLKERLKDTLSLAQEMLQKSSGKYKKYYDRGSKPRCLEVGDEVLVLLPTDKNKLLLQWKGPYKVLQRFNDCDYKVQVDKKVKSFHINLLKKYMTRKSVESEECIFESHYLEATETGKPEVAAFVSEPDEEYEVDDGKNIVSMPNRLRTQGPSDVLISNQLNVDCQLEIQNLVNQFGEVFTDVPKQTSVIECDLQLTTDQPIRSKPYPVPQAMKAVISKEISDMLKLGVIERSSSGYASPVVLVKKKDESVRFCIDFRKVNRVIMFDPEPMPNPEELFAKLRNGKYFSKIDLTKGYWQIPMSERSKEVTAFVTFDGQYQFKFLPFGLVVAGAVFTRMMRKIFGEMNNVVTYIDDLLCYTETWEEHLIVLKNVFAKLQEANLAAKPKKCYFGYQNLEFLGYFVGKGQLKASPALLDKIQSSERPKTKKEVRSFLGLASFYRKFIPNFAEIAVPLSDLTKKGSSTKVKWGESQERSFQTLKALLVKPPILQLPDFNRTFIIQTDASDTGIGCVLMQEYDGILHPVSYASRKLASREQNYSVIEREALAIVWAISKFDFYLYGRQFVVQTDHKPLVYVNKSKTLNKRIMRWAMLLQEYQFSVQSISGKNNYAADFLSRVPAL